MKQNKREREYAYKDFFCNRPDKINVIHHLLS
nr:MAG TPA: hypothetical protein [Caudoviricetes sp.]DAX36921.1 MAG TPA: hypothetical protein [Caudoviricetes sp.]